MPIGAESMHADLVLAIPYSDQFDRTPVVFRSVRHYSRIAPEFEAFRVKPLEPLGEGAFGLVTKGLFRSDSGVEVLVAIKTLKGSASSDDRVAMLQVRTPQHDIAPSHAVPPCTQPLSTARCGYCSSHAVPPHTHVPNLCQRLDAGTAHRMTHPCMT